MAKQYIVLDVYDMPFEDFLLGFDKVDMREYIIGKCDTMQEVQEIIDAQDYETDGECDIWVYKRVEGSKVVCVNR